MQVKRYYWEWQNNDLLLPITFGVKPDFSYKLDTQSDNFFITKISNIERFQLDEQGNISLLLFREQFLWQEQNLFDLMERQVVPMLDKRLTRVERPFKPDSEILSMVFADNFLKMIIISNSFKP